jgi:hypothetical protein
MTSNSKPPAPADLRYYQENRRKFPPEELAKYAGQYVAFNSDGTKILASGANMDEVESQLRATGVRPSDVVGSYIPPPDLALLG